MAINPDRLAARLRFRHLQLLLALEEGGSLRAAAHAMHLTQPALSKALGEIEAAFGVQLFERSARGIAPTARGQVALNGAALLLAQLGHIHQDVVAAKPAQTLRIGAPPFVAQGYLPPVLARLAGGAPPLRITLLEERVPSLLRALAAGEVDALVTSYPAQMPEDLGATLAYEKLFEAQFSVIAPPGHPLAGKRRVGWAALAQAPWVMPARSSMMRRVLEECFLRAGVSQPQPLVESTSPITNIELVAQGLGLGVVPSTAVRAALAQQRVSRLSVTPAIAPNSVALMWRAGPRDLRVEMLRAYLQ
ncbi:LysR family transcriptional regulator [Variovorax sp. RA8]|uniref:LysR family transcriptional regulator n=1 Tax=Variovorax sp. (strain JCM 16519 / RA8) TaxID=662548 RepID=UPI001319860B|nr:LysR substrate-binding domain-containing protein [Variovorax sp. RA8]VTU19329.1 Galactose-binding protein regulator [Variovorax sp. RA8]